MCKLILILILILILQIDFYYISNYNYIINELRVIELILNNKRYQLIKDRRKDNLNNRIKKILEFYRGINQLVKVIELYKLFISIK